MKGEGAKGPIWLCLTLVLVVTVVIDSAVAFTMLRGASMPVAALVGVLIGIIVGREITRWWLK